ncbi:MAG: hypothetical protein K9N49_01225 [Candidatus Marinimicrobia bacterium]|nr:hypothetical protein [Candidatus Neomarinimicrobiota bacterium]
MNDDNTASRKERQAYWADHNHRFHAAGSPPTREWQEYFGSRPAQRIKQVYNRLWACGLMDMAWLVMLYEQGLVDQETVAKLEPILEKSLTEKGFGGEDWIRQNLPDHDEDVASAINYGRTLQEPMGRIMMREGILFALEELQLTRAGLLDKAAENTETVMAGQSHRAHAQPTTWGAYLLAVHDQLARGEEQLELAFRHVNRNTGGCGACSGTGWPVDRERVTELLGFDETVELTYDCEGSMDDHLTTLFAAANIAVTLGRTATDHNNWVSEDIRLFATDMEWRGCSSFMPQKAHAGSYFERLRIISNRVLGQMQTGLLNYHNEPIQDVLPVYMSEEYVINALAQLEGALGMLRVILPHIHPDQKRMWAILREGYSGAPDLAIVLIREKGYGGRAAHRVCATMVRMARERGIPPYDCSAALLQEAASISNDRIPDITDEEVYDCMGLEHFFEKHTNLGDPNPKETLRLVDVRRQAHAQARLRQTERRQHIETAISAMKKRLHDIASETAERL